ncbi:MAG: hypothetical protein GY938_12875 [Ketobacter sp.]|nr:hypothetical protein [Ketobacter sp.]
MTTERFETPLERVQIIEVRVTEPITLTASSFVDYDYYLTRGRRLRSEAFCRMAQRVWRIVRRFVGHYRTHTRLKDNMSKRPSSVGEH